MITSSIYDLALYIEYLLPIFIRKIRRFCKLQDDGQSLMRVVMTHLNLSARAYHRILKLARTIADLAGSEEIQSAHLAEALHLRSSEVDAQHNVMG